MLIGAGNYGVMEQIEYTIRSLGITTCMGNRLYAIVPELSGYLLICHLKYQSRQHYEFDFHIH